MLDLLLSVIIWISILGNFTLGVIVFNKNRHNLVNISLSSFAFASLIWAVTLFFFQHPIFISSFLWLKIVYLNVLLVAIPAFFFFSLAFTQKTLRSIFIPLLIYQIIATPFAYTIIFTNLFVADVLKVEWGFQQVLGPAYLPFGIFAIITSVWTLFNFAWMYRRATGSIRAQVMYMFLGLFFYLVIPITLDIILPLFFKSSRFIWFSPISTIFFLSCASYAIVRHRLLDIRVALQETIIFVLTTLLVGVTVYIGATIYWLTASIPIKPEVVPVTIGIGFALTLMYGRLSNLSKAIASRFFFQSVYDYQQVIKDLSESFATIIDLEKLAEVITDTLSKVLKVNRVGVLAWDATAKQYDIEKTVGFNESNGISHIRQDFLTDYLQKYPQIIILEELDKLKEEAAEVSGKEVLLELENRMKHIEAALIVPIVNAGQLIGLIVLGEKKSGDPYTVQDTCMLNTVASQASVAFENAILYNQLSDLNQNLLKKVDERTSELQNANKELKTLDVMKDQLVAITSHELKTPLSNAQNYLWYVLNNPAAETKLAAEDILRLNKSFLGIQDLVKLINNILNVSKIEAGKLKINLERVEFEKIEEIIKKVMGSFELKLKTKNLKVFYHRAEEFLPAVSVDLMKFEEVLSNLLSNAAKYTDQGEITISVKKEGQTLVFAVSDTGKGIAQEHIHNLFEKFYREDVSLGSSNPETGGTGLGLYITKSLVELMGGRMSVESTLGKGSTFYFTLLIL